MDAGNSPQRHVINHVIPEKRKVSSLPLVVLHRLTLEMCATLPLCTDIKGTVSNMKYV